MTDTDEIQLPALQHIERPMEPQEVLQQSRIVHNILEGVMVKDVHYGVVPGTDKPTLLQPGAEKINMTFRLAPKYTVEDLSEPSENYYRYRVTCSLYTIGGGVFVGSAVGEASSNEEKYQWQAAICDEQWENTALADRRTKYFKADNDAGFDTVKQVRRNAADLANTVLKIACKRSGISATRAATAASDILEVDLDEEAVADVAKQDRGEQPKPKAKAKPAPKMSFGYSKGKHIDDPTVPVNDLQWYKGKIESGLGNPDRAKWAQGDKKMIEALDAELKKRAEKKADAPTDTREPVSDGEWDGFIHSVEGDYLAEYEQALKEFKAQDGRKVAQQQRWAFYDRVQQLIAAQK